MPPADRHPLAARIEEVARSLAGVRFRPQGRDSHGCDCLGLAVQVAHGAGLVVPVPRLPLRGVQLEDAVCLLRRLGCAQIDLAQPGDLMLQTPAALLLHLAIRVEGGLVEAHAGLRQVVVRPLGAHERWHSAWRLPMLGEI